MAGAGYKLFQTGDVLTAAQVNTYLNEQTVMVFASSAARTSALSSVLAEGMVSYLQDTNAVEVYDGSNWVSIGSSGDITSVSAGVGLTGGGTSGAVTLTNDMATTITAAGDIVVGTGSGTYDNLPIGATGQVLTADTTVSPYKVKWATASGSSSGPTFQAYRTTSDQTVTQNAWTKIAFNAEDWDSDNCFDSTTNYRFTPNKAGYYLLTAAIFTSANTAASVDLSFYKNGATNNTCGFRGAASSANFVALGTNLMYFNGSTDYCELYIYMAGASPKVWTRANSECTYFSGVWIRS